MVFWDFFAQVRQVLSLRGMFMRHAKEHGIAQEDMAHVVCELRDVDNRPLVEMVGAGLVEIVCSHDIIGRLMIQCARSTGLAFVLENLMGFDGDEFYLSEWPQVLGQRFGDLFYRFDDAVVRSFSYLHYRQTLAPHRRLLLLTLL